MAPEINRLIGLSAIGPPWIALPASGPHPGRRADNKDCSSAPIRCWTSASSVSMTATRAAWAPGWGWLAGV